MRGNEFRTLPARSAKTDRFSSRISNNANLSCVYVKARAFAEKVGPELDSRRPRRRRRHHAAVSRQSLLRSHLKDTPRAQSELRLCYRTYRFVLFFGEGPRRTNQWHD